LEKIERDSREAEACHRPDMAGEGEQGAEDAARGPRWQEREQFRARERLDVHHHKHAREAQVVARLHAVPKRGDEEDGQLARAGADFIAVITAVWEHPEGPAKAVAEFNAAIKLT
jgi:hypothetical protein